MRDFTKAEKKQAEEVLRKGILRRHAEWHNELRELLNRPYEVEKENEFDRSMMIIKSSRKFYKEALALEDYYRTTMLPFGLRNLYHDGYLTTEDISVLPSDFQDWLQND